MFLFHTRVCQDPEVRNDTIRERFEDVLTLLSGVRCCVFFCYKKYNEGGFFLIIFSPLVTFKLFMFFGFNTNSWGVDFIEFCLGFIVLLCLRIKNLNVFCVIFSHPHIEYLLVT